MRSVDLIIIGAGPGGYRAAEYAAKQGLQVVIVEQDEVGGTCLNRGCIPTKTYVHSATFSEAVERQQQVVTQLRTGVEQLMAAPGITLIRGHAHFLDAHTVRVAASVSAAGPVLASGSALVAGSALAGGSDFVAGSALAGGSALVADSALAGGFDFVAGPALAAGSLCGDTIAAKSIIIATGSTAKLLPLPDISDPRVMTSTELLQLQTLPKRLAIICTGVIGMEFASVFQRFGSEVTVIEYLKECLPMLDSDVAKCLRKLLEKRGITFKMKTPVQSLSGIDADVILMATGRKANTEGLNLEAAGITPAPNGTIAVDDNLQVVSASNGGSLSGLYAIGDVNGRQMLAHAAEMQAVRAINHILGKPDGIRFDVMPAAIFTEPEAL